MPGSPAKSLTSTAASPRTLASIHRVMRPRATAETCVVLLITQRSQVQIPAPVLVSAGQGFLSVGEDLLRAGAVVKRVPETGSVQPRSETGWHRKRQPGRDGRLPSMIAGCLAQSCRKRIRSLPVCVGPAGGVSGLSRYPAAKREIRPCSVNDGAAGRCGADAPPSSLDPTDYR
jgi:hypothetical protein